jgi:hypothetical protein
MTTDNTHSQAHYLQGWLLLLGLGTYFDLHLSHLGAHESVCVAWARQAKRGEGEGGQLELVLSQRAPGCCFDVHKI